MNRYQEENPHHWSVLKDPIDKASETILAASSHINQTDANGLTLLHLAACRKDGRPLVQLLLLLGADKSLKTEKGKRGHTPLDSARGAGTLGTTNGTNYYYIYGRFRPEDACSAAIPDLESGLATPLPDSVGRTYVLLACLHGCVLLLDKCLESASPALVKWVKEDQTLRVVASAAKSVGIVSRLVEISLGSSPAPVTPLTLSAEFGASFDDDDHAKVPKDKGQQVQKAVPPTSGAVPPEAAPPKSTTPVTPLTLSAEDKGLLGDWAVAAQEDLMRRLRTRCTKEAGASASPSSLSGLPSLSTAVAGHLRDLATHAGAPWAARVSDAAAQTEAVARSMAELSALRVQVSKGHRGKDMAMQVRAVQTHKVSELEALRDALLATLGTGGGHKFDPNIPRSALTLDKKSFAKGSFSRAYKGTYHDTPIVAKVFKTDEIPADALKKNVAKEAALMAKCSHPCVVRSHGVCVDFDEGLEDPFVALVMDPYPEGTARDLLEKTGGPLPSADAARILESVAWGLDHLHGLGIVHKDLKVENILIDRDEDGRALGVVSDFGLSVDLASASARYNNSGGTVSYLAPEQLKPFASDGITPLAITPKADMYAFGVVAWVLATSKEPWEGVNQLGITQLVTEDKRLIFPAPAPADEKWAAIQELAKECFNADPNTRPTAQQAAERLKKL